MLEVLWGKKIPQSSIQNAHMKRAVGEEDRLSFRNAVAVLALIFSLHSHNSFAVTDDIIPFYIPQQRADTALTLFAEQANLTLVFPFDQVKDKTANRLVGDYPVQAAVELLLHNTGLTPLFSDQLVLNIAIESKGKNMNTNKRKSLLATMVGLMAAGGLSTAAAQETESARAQGVLDEIIVTSTRRAESLNDAALSVAAIGGEELSRRGISGMEDYLATISGVSFLDQGVGKNGFIIRGISADSEGETWRTGPSVGLYFGEVPLAGLGTLGGGANLRLVDIERVEVLRGPQGTLFGAGSLAGAVRNIPVAPNLQNVEGKLNLGFSSTGENGGANHKIEGVINLPVIEDVLAVRAVAYKHDNDGYIKNIRASDPDFSTLMADAGISGFSDTSNIGETETTGGRISTLFAPSENLKITLQHVEEEANQIGHPEAQLSTGGYTQVRAPFGNLTLFSPIHQKTFSSGDEEGLSVDLSFTNLVLEYAFDGADLLVSTSKIRQDNYMARDLTSLFGAPVIQQVELNVDATVHEARLVSNLDGAFQYILGAFYEDRDTTQAVYISFAGDIPLSPFGAPFSSDNPMFSDEFADRNLEQRAFFAEFSYDFSEQVTLTAGGRHFNYERESLAIAAGAFGNTLATGGITTNSEESGTNYKINLSYTPSDDSLLYVQWAEGFRPGNVVNPAPANLCDLDDNGILDGTSVEIRDSFDADNLETYELGIKSTLMENRLQVNASIYRSNWEGVPINVQSPTCLLSQTSNAGEARTQGFEVETLYNISPKLQLILGGSYVDAELTEDALSLGGRSGDRLPGSPDYSVNLGVEYDFDLANRPAYVRGDYAYVSGFHNDLAETSVEAGDYGRVNLKAGVSIDNFHVELFGNNLTNEDAITWPGTFVIRARVNRLMPRTIGFNVGYQF